MSNEPWDDSPSRALLPWLPRMGAHEVPIRLCGVGPQREFDAGLAYTRRRGRSADFDADEATVLLERSSEIGIVVTDIEMPGSMDGLELATCIRERWPDIKYS